MNQDLPLEQLRWIDAAASRFERAWATANRLNIESLLAEAPAALRPAALRELLALELELRRQAGDSIHADEFVRRFPTERALIGELLAAMPADSAATSFLVGGSGATQQAHAAAQQAQAAARQAHSTTRPADAEGATIGPFTLERVLGAGGMGVVWVARQNQPVKRRVALKLIKRGMDSGEVVRRFEQERLALAVLDHPHIARVLDAGITPDGRPYFAMELINGLPLTQFCDEARLSTRQRLELFRQICFAVQHAHQKGIIHRDLKPANILVTLIDGLPVPKVIDFGVAKALGGNLRDDSPTTNFGAVIGTLEYMAPEQAGYSGVDIDTRADIYALGVILYELLTGLRPLDAAIFRQAAVDEMIRMIREDQPFTPSKRLSTSDALPSLAAARQTDPLRLTRALRGDLDWIAMKCLEKDRGRRYRTADQLAEEVRRHLADEPVEAGPPDRLYLLRKFVKRHRGQVLAGALLAAAILIGLAVSLWQLSRAVVAERVAVRAEARATDRANAATIAQREALAALAKSKVHQARGARRSHRPGGRTDAVARLQEAQQLDRELTQQGHPLGAEFQQELRDETASAWLLPEITTELLPPLDYPQPTTVGVADFLQQRFVEFPARDAAFLLRDLKTGKQLAAPKGKIAEINYAEFSDDGNWLFTAGPGPWLEVWNLQGERPFAAWSLHGWQVSAHSRTHPLVVATSDGKTATVYDRATGQELYKDLKGTPPWGNPFSPDGRRVVLYRDGEMFVLDLATQTEAARWSPATNGVFWNAAGDQLAVTVDGRELQLRDPHTGALLHAAGGFRGGLRAVIDGRQNLVFTHDWNRTAQLSDARTGRLLLSLPFAGYAGVLQMSGRGERLDLLDRRDDRHAAVTLSRGLLTEFAAGVIGAPVVSQDGSLAAATIGASICLYDLSSGRQLCQRGFPADCEAVVFEGRDAVWVSNGWQQPSRAERWPLVRKRVAGVEQIAFGETDRVCQAPNGAHWKAIADASLFAVGGNGDRVYIMRPNRDGPKPPEPEVLQTNQSALRHTALSEDGRWLLAGGHMTGGVGVYERSTGKLAKMLNDQGGWGRFSPDGSLVAVGETTDRGEVYRCSDWRRLYSLPGAGFNFSHDGVMLAVNDGGSGLLLLEAATGKLLLRLEIPESTSVVPACFTRDGEALLATANDPSRIIKIDLSGLRNKLSEAKLDW